MKHRKCWFVLIFCLWTSMVCAQDWVVYEGDSGPGKGKHIVFIASDHEYRAEETCPAMARILAKRYGFKCTVLFGLDEKGYIKAGSSRIPGMKALEDADMLFMFTRFLAPDDESMKYFEAYLDRGGPVLGLRTTTHGFKGLSGQYAKYNFRYGGNDFKNGFGRQILGESWAGHYGRNHRCSTRLDIIPEQAKHPILQGVKDMHTKAGAYFAKPMPDSVILANNQVLKTMEQGSEALENKPPVPAVWVRNYKSKSGKEGRVFCSTQGAGEDIVNEGFRRCIINGVFWCMGMENEIKPDLNVDFVGPYNPVRFSFHGERKLVKPSDIEGWDTPIWNQAAPTKKEWVTYEGESGPGKGKHIVFLASDHEYRAEETCPAIARILAKRLGFKCTVLFGLDEKGFVKAGSSNIPGMRIIEEADMLFVFTRFLAPNDYSMKYFDAYLERGGPVLGLRTTTHAFKGLGGKYAKYNFRYGGKEFEKGFGRQILGETWAGHYGRNHRCSTRLDIIPDQAMHPVLKGVKDMHTKAGAYFAKPMPDSIILANNQVLKTMEQGSEALEGKPPVPAVWVRNYTSKSGKKGRVFCSTQGAGEDIVNEGFRRCIINGVLWCMGMEKEIKADLDVAFVGPYNPVRFSFGGERKGVRPTDIKGWNSPIWNSKAPTKK